MPASSRGIRRAASLAVRLHMAAVRLKGRGQSGRMGAEGGDGDGGAGLEETGPVASEGVGAREWSRALRLGDSQALHAAVASNGNVLRVAAYGRPVDLGGGPLPFDRAVHSLRVAERLPAWEGCFPQLRP